MSINSCMFANRNDIVPPANSLNKQNNDLNISSPTIDSPNGKRRRISVMNDSSGTPNSSGITPSNASSVGSQITLSTPVCPTNAPDIRDRVANQGYSLLSCSTESERAFNIVMRYFPSPTSSDRIIDTTAFPSSDLGESIIFTTPPCANNIPKSVTEKMDAHLRENLEALRRRLLGKRNHGSE